ncbi:hypothetical protein AQPE_4647 [Aquipluma nitroreducens]|uniref:Uncharacterized protein n=1 Tax=Aquipluma nitroreducens TaxID=2010828 RepID=A0A5K7SG40_9BACT|nr:hypothetical protein AQPE_4647 [Aquipluma nitroreducens]
MASGTPVKISAYRTLSCHGSGQWGACQFHARNGQSMKLNASEGNEP